MIKHNLIKYFNKFKKLYLHQSNDQLNDVDTNQENFSEINLNSLLNKFFLEVTSIATFTFRFFKEVIKPPYEFNELIKQSFLIGYKSFPLIAITGFIIGLVLTIQTRPTLAKSVSYTHLRAHETVLDIVCRLLLEKKKKQIVHSLLRK